MSKLSTFRELLRFLRLQRKIWLVPLILMLVFLSGILAVAQGSALGPFIYTMF